jgi:hypothetical protein
MVRSPQQLSTVVDCVFGKFAGRIPECPKVGAPGDASARPPSRRERLKRYAHSWTRPQVTFAPAHRVTRDDVNARVARLEISNLGRARSRPRQLVVVDTIPALHVPSIRGGRTIEVTPSFVDDANAAPGDSFWWSLRDHRGRGGGVSIGATKVSEMPRLQALFAEHEAGRKDEGPDNQASTDGVRTPDP